jgi:hypothetical protein
VGLTIHWSMRLDPQVTGAREVRALMERLRQHALDLPFERVSHLAEFKGKDCNFENHKARHPDDPWRWMKIQASGNLQLDEHTWQALPPWRIVGFHTWPGEGCEPADFGLCLYPKAVALARSAVEESDEGEPG